MTRRTAAAGADSAGQAFGHASTDRLAALRTNAPASVPQRAPRFPDTPWGRLRAVRRWSLRELARRSGINPADLSRIERFTGGAQPDQALLLLVAYGLIPAVEPAPESATHPGPELTAYAEQLRQIVPEEP